MADWPADQLALLDALDIERTGVVTQSGGTGYGVAVAASAPQRLTGLALLGGLAPMTSREARMDAGKQLRTAVFLARTAPFVLKAGLRQTFKKLPDSAIAQVPAADRPFLGDPLIRDIHLRTMREFLGNPDAAIEEIRLLARPWGITPPPAGAVPTALWTGELDEAHPPAHARRVAELLGGDPPVTVVPGVGTFGLGRVFPDVLRFAVGR
jgi:pimeloyl-ACP methyl ester carboxylesterase